MKTLLVVLGITVGTLAGFMMLEQDRISQRVLYLEQMARVDRDQIARLGQAVRVERIEYVTVTAYSPRVQETDDTPYITASNTRVAEGTIAVSRDLWLAGWAFGKKVFIECASGKKGREESKAGLCGIFLIQDAMNQRYTKRIDIFIHSTKKARAAGIRLRVAVLQSL